MSIKTLSNFQEEVIDSKGVVVLDFYLEKCVPCRMLHPIMMEIAEERKGITVFEVKVEQFPDLVKELNIRCVPAILIFKEGELVNRLSNMHSKEYLLGLLK